MVWRLHRNGVRIRQRSPVGLGRRVFKRRTRLPQMGDTRLAGTLISPFEAAIATGDRHPARLYPPAPAAGWGGTPGGFLLPFTRSRGHRRQSEESADQAAHRAQSGFHNPGRSTHWRRRRHWHRGTTFTAAGSACGAAAKGAGSWPWPRRNRREVALIVSQSGPAVTPKEQELYRCEQWLKADGFSEPEIAEAMQLARRRYECAETDTGWEGTPQKPNARPARSLGIVTWAVTRANAIRFGATGG